MHSTIQYAPKKWFSNLTTNIQNLQLIQLLDCISEGFKALFWNRPGKINQKNSHWNRAETI